MNIISKNIIALSFALASVTAVNAGSHSMGGMLFYYDTNKDGVVDSKEYNKVRANKFKATDSNGDGSVTTNEYASEYESRLGGYMAEDRKRQVERTYTRFDVLDYNKDKAISWDEMSKSGKRAFARFDTNEDGVITSADPKPVRAMKSKSDQAKKEAKKKKKGYEMRRPASFRMATTHSKSGIVKTYDEDGDKSVTWAEFQKVRQAKYTATDMDGNGSLNVNEYVAEFEDRLDAKIKKTRVKAVEQTYVRFKFLDKDESGGISPAEYKASGDRMFTRLDTDKNGKLTRDDKKPEGKKKAGKKKADKKSVKSSY